MLEITLLNNRLKKIIHGHQIMRTVTIAISFFILAFTFLVIILISNYRLTQYQIPLYNNLLIVTGYPHSYFAKFSGREK